MYRLRTSTCPSRGGASSDCALSKFSSVGNPRGRETRRISELVMVEVASVHSIRSAHSASARRRVAGDTGTVRIYYAVRPESPDVLEAAPQLRSLPKFALSPHDHRHFRLARALLDPSSEATGPEGGAWMAKRSKALPARKSARSRDDDSVLIRTAESLGRMIGSLQRQLQDATSHVSDAGETALDALPELPRLDDVFGGEQKKATARSKSSSRGAARKKAPRKSAK